MRFVEEDIRQRVEEDDRWANAVPIKESDMVCRGPRLTVCEMLREIYVKTEDPEIKLICRMATTMAKELVMKITRVEGAWWGRDFYPWNPKVRHGRIKAKWGDRKGDLGWAGRKRLAGKDEGE